MLKSREVEHQGRTLVKEQRGEQICISHCGHESAMERILRETLALTQALLVYSSTRGPGRLTVDTPTHTNSGLSAD